MCVGRRFLKIRSHNVIVHSKYIHSLQITCFNRSATMAGYDIAIYMI